MNKMSETVGNLVRRERRAKGWTLEKLSQKSGLAKSTISNIENNRVGSGNQRTIEALASALGLSLDFFSGGFGNKAPDIAEIASRYATPEDPVYERAKHQAERLINAARMKRITGTDLDLIDAVLNYLSER